MQAIAPDPKPVTQPEVLPSRTRVAFVTNFAPHYRVGMFEALAAMCDLQCYFYSDGGEWYWQSAHGVHRGKFRGRYLRGFWLGRTRIALGLLPSLLLGGHDVFVKCINDRLALPATYLAARLLGRPFVLWTGVWCRLTTPLQRLLFPLKGHLYRRADAIVAYGEHVRRYLLSEGVEPHRIFLAPQAVDNERYARPVADAARERLRARLGIAAETKILLYVGRLEPVKGLEILLRAFATTGVANTALVLCGTGTIEPSLRRLATQLGIAARVIFAGYVPAAETIDFYSAAWAAVLPSVTMPQGRETWGLVANEAFNQGVPIVTSDAVGAAAGGFVVHLRNGLIVKEGDVQALARALDLVTGDDALRAEMSVNARRDVASWTHTRMAEGFRDAIHFALRARSGT